MKNLKRFVVVVLTLLVVVSAFTACDLKITQQQKLIGSWRDSTGTTGYEFKDGGACVITYADVNLPILGNINTSVDGTYSVTKKDDGNYYLTVTYTLITTVMTDEFIFNVDGNSLTLTNVKDGKVLVLMAYAPVETTVAAQAS